MLPLKPDMASLSVGSNNFPTRVYENPPDLVDWLAAEMRAHDVTPEIEAFDLSHIHQAVAMHKDGRLPKKLYMQFVMGVKNAMPVDRDVFDYYIRTVERLAPRLRNGAPPGSGGTSWTSTNGPSPRAGTPAPVWRTMSACRKTGSRRQTRHW